MASSAPRLGPTEKRSSPPPGHRSPLLLALDTSTRHAGIALYSGEHGLVSELMWHSPFRHTVELIPWIRRLMDQAAISPSDLGAVGVASGPGSFTGLRVALATAKGLALASGVALIGVPTLDVVAYPHIAQPLPVVAILPAGRGRLYWAVYGAASASAGPTAQTPVRLAAPEALAEEVEGPALFAGEMERQVQELLARRLGPRATFLSPALGARRPGHLAELAWSRFVSGVRDDPAGLTPLYLQEPTGRARTGD